MKFIIDKSFSFCYGHRVHNQRLDTNFTESGDACLACRHLHGHEGLVKIFLEEDIYDGDDSLSNVEKTGMVTDFKHLGWFKNFIDDTLDHKFIMDLKDPLFNTEFPICASQSVDFDIIKMPNNFYIPNMTRVNESIESAGFNKAEADAVFEKYEGAVFVNFVPTSENLTAWLLSVVQEKMDNLSGIKVKAIEYWETPKSHCRVEA